MMSPMSNNKTILILGGYGNAGRNIAKLLFQETAANNTNIIVAGRSLERAQAVVDQLAADTSRRSDDDAGNSSTKNNPDRLRALQVDASSPLSLQTAFRSIDMVVVASSTTAFTRNVVEAALEAHIDYFDIQLERDEEIMSGLKPRIEEAGRYFVTEGGYHPGTPAALVRYASQLGSKQRQHLVSAKLYIFSQPDAKELQISDSTKEEFILEISKMDNRLYRNGKWEKQGWSVQEDFDFGGEYKTQTCAPLYLDELGDLPAELAGNKLEEDSSLEELGMYIGGFNPVTIFLIMPICLFSIWLFPELAVKPMGNLFLWSLQKFTSPPYGSVMTLDAWSRDDNETTKADPKGSSAASDATKTHWLIRIAHKDAYVFTAVPAVACILQMLDQRLDDAKDKMAPGLYRQGHFVDPIRFLSDLERLGLDVTVQQQRQT